MVQNGEFSTDLASKMNNFFLFFFKNYGSFHDFLQFLITFQLDISIVFANLNFALVRTVYKSRPDFLDFKF